MDRETAIEKVLIHLAETRGSWSLKGGQLRREYNTCPVNSLAGYMGCLGVIDNAEEIGIDRMTANDIAEAADFSDTLLRSLDEARGTDLGEIRSKMLLAAGVVRK